MKFVNFPEPIIFAGARDSKGAQKTKIYFILSDFISYFVILGPEKCEISKNLGPCVEV
jgi:hypothetical protein